MKSESAVQFASESRIHVALPVRNLELALDFYRTLFGQAPTKVRARYAKFEVAEPSVNLALNELEGPTGPSNPVAHFGIQVKSTEAVQRVVQRLKAAKFGISVEENVTCCYAVQNKVWATDPDGNKWEVYVVLNNNADQHHSTHSDCCADRPGCCEDKAACCTTPAGAQEGMVASHQSACACSA